MKAIVQDKFGSADVLQLRDVDIPEIGDDDVLVRVHAAGIGPDVWHLMAGMPYLVRIMGMGFSKPKAQIRGSDAAGSIEAIGKNVTQFQPGDEVFGSCDGTKRNGALAEYALAKENDLARKPTKLTFEQAAAVPISGCTALQGLRKIGKLKTGQKVLIIGAAGGVGSFAVQIAKALGAEVTGVCSTSKVKLVETLGADHVVDYTREDFVDGLHKYDVILDTAGRRSLRHLRHALAPQGILVIVGGEGGGRWFGGFQRQILWAPLMNFRKGPKLTMVMAKVCQEDLKFLAELVDADKITPVIDSTYPLSDSAEAIRHLAAGHAKGKIIVTV